ncbi:hypothetical protein ABPG74_016103 [Tetrahymena malaccensis]
MSTKICLESSKLANQSKMFEKQYSSQSQEQHYILDLQDQVEEFKNQYKIEDSNCQPEDCQSIIDTQDEKLQIENIFNEYQYKSQFLVLGETGVGKSSFIKKITKDQSIQISSDKDSITKECLIFKKDSYLYIDTPGINDNKKNRYEILLMIVQFLYEKQMKLEDIFIILIQNDALKEVNTLIEFSYTYFLYGLFKNNIDQLEVQSLVEEYINSSYLLNWSENGLHLKRDELFQKRRTIFENKHKASNYFEYVYNYHIRVQSFFDEEEEENLQSLNQEMINNFKEQIWSDKNREDVFYAYKDYIKDQKTHLLNKIQNIQKLCIQSRQQDQNKDIQNIILVGKSQVGKSSLIEQLTNISGLRGSGKESKTLVCQIYYVEYGNVIYRFIDTPGFSGTENNQTLFHSFKIIADFLSRNQIKEFKLLFMKNYDKEKRDTVEKVLREFFLLIAYIFDQDVSFIDLACFNQLLKDNENSNLDKLLLKNKILLILRSKKSDKFHQIDENFQYTFFKNNFKTDAGKLCKVDEELDLEQKKKLFQKIDNIEYISIDDKVLFRIRQSMLQGIISSTELFIKEFHEIASKYEERDQISYKIENFKCNEINQDNQENLNSLRNQRLNIIVELKNTQFNVLGNIYLGLQDKIKIFQYSDQIKNFTLRHFLPIQNHSILFEITEDFPQSVLLSRKQHFYSIFAHQLSQFVNLDREDHRKKLEELAEIKVAQEICFHQTEHLKFIEKNYENKAEENLLKLYDLSKNLNLIFGYGISTYKHATYVNIFIESINMLPVLNTAYVVWADLFLAPLRIGYDLYQEYKGYISNKQLEVNILSNFCSGTLILCSLFIPGVGQVLGAIAGFIALFGYGISRIIFTSKSTFNLTIGKVFHNILEDSQANQSLRYFEIAELLREKFQFTNYSQLKSKIGYNMFRQLEKDKFEQQQRLFQKLFEKNENESIKDSVANYVVKNYILNKIFNEKEFIQQKNENTFENKVIYLKRIIHLIKNNLQIAKVFYNKSNYYQQLSEISQRALNLLQKKLKSEKKRLKNIQNNQDIDQEIAAEELQLINQYVTELKQFYNEISQEGINYEKQVELSKGILRWHNRFQILFNSYCNLTYLKIEQKLKQRTISEIEKDEQQMKFVIKDDIKNQQNQSIFQIQDDQQLGKLLDLLGIVDKYTVNRYIQKVQSKDNKNVKPNLTCLSRNEVLEADLEFSLDLHKIALRQNCQNEQNFIEEVKKSLKQEYANLQEISKKSNQQKKEELNLEIGKEIEDLFGNGQDMNQRIKHFYQSVQYLKEYFN